MKEKQKQVTRPGEILFESPIQGRDNNWYLFGKIVTDPTILRDIKYSEGFWQRQNNPKTITSLRVAMKTAIISGITHSGQLSVFVGKDGINNETDRQRLSAYRLMATCMGYQVGEYSFNTRGFTASAPVSSR